MLGITNANLEEIVKNFFDNISQISGLEIEEKQELSDVEPGQATLIYEGEKYFIGFYPSEFSLPESYLKGSYFFSNEEIHVLRNANKALTIFMKFNKNSQKSYHLQLKILEASVPQLVGVMDESAEKIIPAKWVKLATQTNILPSDEDLYTVQAILGDNDEIWLHTHGLCRCGLTELEILKSNQENYYYHCNIIRAFAGFLLDRKNESEDKYENDKEFEAFKDCANIGFLSNMQLIDVTYLSWTKALNLYDNLDVGGVNDRKEGHNSKTSVIFLYKNEEDKKEGKLSLISEFNNLWGDNPVFFVSVKETERMKELARERFYVVVEQAKKPENRIEIKIALPIKEREKDSTIDIWIKE